MIILALAQTGGPFVMDGTEAAWRGLLAIGVVLALMGLLAWLIRRGHLPIGKRAGRGALAIDSVLPLGERRSLAIVSIEGRRLLIGLTASQVSLVTELAPAPPTFGAVLESAEKEPHS